MSGEHPLRIGDKYAGQFDRADIDLPRRRADEEQIDELRQGASRGVQAHPGAEAFEEAWQDELSRYVVETEEDQPSGEHVVHDAIAQAVTSAGARVSEAQQTPEQRLARAIAVELKAAAQGDDEGYNTSVGPPSPSPAEHAQLLAELEDKDLDWAEEDDEEF